MPSKNNTLTVYRASAGSGKTFRLAVEYISLLMESPSNEEFKHILAVTFTNKATAEMKDRILGQLYGLGNHLKSSSDYEEAVLNTLDERGVTMSPEALALKSRAVLSAILHDYHYFRVETIDSFFQSILRSLAHELGLSANLQVELDDAELISKAVDQMIDELNEVYDGLVQWILQYVEDKMQEAKSWDISLGLKEFAKNVYKEEFYNRKQEERDALANEGKIKHFRREMNLIISEEKAAVKALVETSLLDLDAETNGFSIFSRGKASYRGFVAKLPDAMEKFQEPTETIKKIFADEVDGMLLSKDKSDPEMIRLALSVAQRIKEIYEKYEQHFRRCKTAAVAIQYINELRLLGIIEEYATAVAESNNQFLLCKTPALLRELVKSSDAPFVYEKAGIQFRHIMIDEFQDTSTMQWENFQVLLFNNKSVGGRDLIVGDVKQSIYRWRGGDWRILHRFNDTKTLQKNFRSMGNVMNFNNAFFLAAREMLDEACPEMEKVYKVTEIYGDVKQEIASEKKVGKGYVRLHLFTADKNVISPEDYDRKVACDLREQIIRLHEGREGQNGLPFNRMAIVVRYNNAGENLINLFRQIEHEDANEPCIPLISDQAYMLSASLAVNVIVAALHVLADVNHPDDVNLRNLSSLYHKEVLRDDKTHAELNMENPYTLLPEDFAQHLKELSQMPLYLLVERLYLLFSLDRLQGQGAYMMAFLDHVSQFLQNASSDIRSFLQLWKESLHRKSIPSGEMDGVRILTIHKSKGLEYDAVFIPDLDWKIEAERKNMGSEMWSRSQPEFETLGPLPVSPNKELLHTFYSSAYELEHLDRRVETLNLLYVAFTRAKANLYVWGRYSPDVVCSTMPSKPWKDVLKQDSLACDMLKLFLMQKDVSYQASDEEMLWEVGEPFFGDSEKENAEENRMDAKKTDIEQPFHTFFPHQTFLPSNATMRYLSRIQNNGSEEINQQAWEVGLIVHRILSHIHHLDEVDEALEMCELDGLITDASLAEKVRERLTEGFKLPQVKRWFSKDAKIFNECTITGRNAENGEPIVRRPDRVVMAGDDIYLVDFKLGRDNPDYHDQVRGYMHLLAQMYPSKRIHGFLWFILKGKVVDVT